MIEKGANYCDTLRGGVPTLADWGVLTVADCVLRINRYTQGLQRRPDNVYPDPTLVLSGSSYTLRAVISHQGASAQRGHYIMYLRTAKGWERREAILWTRQVRIFIVMGSENHGIRGHFGSSNFASIYERLLSVLSCILESFP